MSRPLKLLLGLSASVEAGRSTFRPLTQQHGIPLLAVSRWRGFAAAINHGFAEKLVMLGGQEKLKETEVPSDVRAMLDAKPDPDGYIMVPRGLATIHGLIRAYEVPADRLDYEVTVGNTGGNVGAINRVLKASGLQPEEVGVSTNLYHLPRAFMDLHDAGFTAIKPIPAEAFWLATTAKDSPKRKVMLGQLTDEFGQSPLTKRVVMELNGAADKLLDSYEALSS